MEVVVTGKRRLADDVVELALAPTSGTLPPWEPGAHVSLHLPGGYVRQYSLCGEPADRGEWRIAVLLVAGGRGGSRAVHLDVEPGCPLAVDGPRNDFPLVEAERYFFLAGGIGITPIVAMAERAAGLGTPFELLYLARRRTAFTFADRLERLGRCSFWPDDELGVCDVPARLEEAGAGEGCAVYACGPEPLLAVVERCATSWPAGTLHLERFAAAPAGGDVPFEVELRRSGIRLAVPRGCSVLDAVERAGVRVLSSCRAGTCGTCETDVLEGTPDHRDTVLGAAEREAGDIMMICVSRSRSPRLVLDL